MAAWFPQKIFLGFRDIVKAKSLACNMIQAIRVSWKSDFKCNMLVMNDLSPDTDERNASLSASFPTHFSVSLILKDIPGSFCEF